MTFFSRANSGERGKQPASSKMLSCIRVSCSCELCLNVVNFAILPKLWKWRSQGAEFFGLVRGLLRPLCSVTVSFSSNGGCVHLVFAYILNEVLVTMVI